MRRFWWVCLVLSLTAVVRAQTDAPLILWSRGDLWVADPAANAPPAPLTANGTISSPVLAPDGVRIAFRAAAPLALEALPRLETEGVIADFDLPTDLYIQRPTDDAALQIVAQPPGASLFVEGVADNALTRSAPAWSPDATQVAWTELLFGTEQARIAVYGIEGDASRTLAALDVPVTGGYAPPLTWGTDGLAVLVPAEDAGASIVVYNAQGDRIYETAFALEGVPQVITWLEGGTLAILDDSGTWWGAPVVASFQPMPGDYSPVPLDTAPELYSPLAPDTSLRLTFGLLPDQGFFWEAFDPLAPDAASVAFPGAPHQVALSPDGRAVAFIDPESFGAAAVYRDGQITPIPTTGDALPVGALLWGPAAWRLPAQP